MNYLRLAGRFLPFFMMLLFAQYAQLNALTIKLIWGKNAEPDVMYYSIFRDTTSVPINEIAKIYAPDTCFYDSNVELYKTYYYRITAIDSAENVSEFSEEVFIATGKTTPVALASFEVYENNDVIELCWNTYTESNNHGFEIQKSYDRAEFKKIGFVKGHGNTSDPHSYNFTDQINKKGKYYYRLKQIDFDGNYTYSQTANIEINSLLKFQLSQNYPNPFNPATLIQYSVNEKCRVKLAVYDILGQEVALLVNGQKSAGNYSVIFDASYLESGLYIYQLENGKTRIYKKMMFTK